jgi:hypothetical protein
LNHPWHAIRDRLWAASRPRLPKLYYTNGGIGDELMLTAVARAARAAGRPIPILASYPDLWRNNSDPATLQTSVERWHYAQRRGWIRTELVHLAYRTGAPGHIGEQMAAVAGVVLPRGWRPILPVTPAASRRPRLVVVQNSCRGARYAATTKEWPQERWRELALRLSRDCELVQIGSPQDPRLEAARDLRGQTTLLGAASLLAEAALFIGLESGLQHVAAAMETKSVIIYGGRSRPSETGYPFNHNLTRSPSCVGCGLNNDCPYGVMCMDIPVEDVEAAARAALAGASPNSHAA